MLDPKRIRTDLENVKKAMAKRGENIEDLEKFSGLDQERRELLVEVEALKNQRNIVSEEVALKKRNKENAEDLIIKMRDVSQQIKDFDEKIRIIDEKLEAVLLNIPNVPHDSVPMGETEDDNVVERIVGEQPSFDFEVKAHWDLGTSLGILDFESAGKVTGARFAFYKGLGARLERALINFMLDLHTTEHGYEEVLPPYIVNRMSMIGTGQLPKFEDDAFKINDSDYYLIPTAEVPVTNLFRDDILANENLPIKYAAFSACFRKEAGAAGRDTRGLIRQHQFNKVELVKFVRPEDSYNELELLVKDAEKVLKLLKLPYRVMLMCTADLGFTAAKKYDIEVWMPSYGTYREISSCSNFEDFQARRAKIRFRREEKGKPEFVHTLNGSGLAIGRTVASLLENYQQPDGSVIIPEVLRPYMGGAERIIRK